MANTPKVVRSDAKRIAAGGRKSNGKPFTVPVKANLSGFKKSDIKPSIYQTRYRVNNSGMPKRTREFYHGFLAKEAVSRAESIDAADKDYKEQKAWKAANPDYFYAGGIGDR